MTDRFETTILTEQADWLPRPVVIRDLQMILVVPPHTRRVEMNRKSPLFEMIAWTYSRQHQYFRAAHRARRQDDGAFGARLVQLTLDDVEATCELMDKLLAKKRAGDRKSWLETKGNLAEVMV